MSDLIRGELVTLSCNVTAGIGHSGGTITVYAGTPVTIQSVTKDGRVWVHRGINVFLVNEFEIIRQN